ncbi:hypothetical protein CSW98_01565 [Vibrio sp. HA2012]|uniref:hypothetical protein n=1 Tax=Vibrio sp. HA2012 TaxID=1971595 RepID=UPI000C2B7FAD|nr:hypothetical protein [Vibrio sp. HA2012]PJC87839.1 hypothetical protein CSW98_01565 [Vibrio sp. HA2012]
MNMVPVSDFLPGVRQLVHSPIQKEMDQAIVRSAIKFSRDSLAVLHKRSIDNVFDGEVVSFVAKSGINRRTPGSLKAAEVFSVSADGEVMISGTDYTALSLDELQFLHDSIKVEISGAVEPTPAAEYLPDVLYKDWVDAICHGAAYYLLLPTDPNRAAIYERELIEGIRKAKRWRIESSADVAIRIINRNRSFF